MIGWAHACQARKLSFIFASSHSAGGEGAVNVVEAGRARAKTAGSARTETAGSVRTETAGSARTETAGSARTETAGSARTETSTPYVASHSFVFELHVM
jgi:hypothetical protein